MKEREHLGFESWGVAEVARQRQGSWEEENQWLHSPRGEEE